MGTDQLLTRLEYFSSKTGFRLREVPCFIALYYRNQQTKHFLKNLQNRSNIYITNIHI